MTYKIYQPAYPPNQDITFLKRLWAEFYLRFPTVEFRPLDDTQGGFDRFYQHASREERIYSGQYQINLREQSGSAPEDQNLSYHGIDTTKSVIFYICVVQFEVLGIDLPKTGDVIIFEKENPEQEYEILSVQRPWEARFASSNFCFERELQCARPSPGK